MLGDTIFALNPTDFYYDCDICAYLSHLTRYLLLKRRWCLISASILWRIQISLFSYYTHVFFISISIPNLDFPLTLSLISVDCFALTLGSTHWEWHSNGMFEVKTDNPTTQPILKDRNLYIELWNKNDQTPASYKSYECVIAKFWVLLSCAVSFMNCVESVLLLLGFNFPMDLEVKSGGFVDQKQSNITQKRAFGDYIAVTICIWNTCTSTPNP